MIKKLKENKKDILKFAIGGIGIACIGYMSAKLGAHEVKEMLKTGHYRVRMTTQDEAKDFLKHLTEDYIEIGKRFEE